MQARGLNTVSSLQDRVLHAAGAGAALLRALSVQPAALFDDPEQARQLRIVLASCLRASAVPKVWLAECAGPEQAWSLAILLAEEQLHLRTEIYATVANEEMLAAAGQASFPAERMDDYQESYFKSGGTANLTDYFDVRDGRATLLASLRSRITWAQYNMVTDASFNEFQMIICQRALPDFGPLLRQRVLRLFHDSLSLFGVLGLDREIADGDPLAESYQAVFPHQPWYKRIR
jgi:chemotaxis protein methyltransferase CheR